MNGQTTTSPAIGDDTIELELTPEQLLALSQAGEQEEPAAPAPISAVTAPGRISAFFAPPPLFKVGTSSRSGGWYHTPMAKMAGAVIGYLTFAWWGASQLAWQPQPPATAAARPAIVSAGPALIAISSKPAVRVTNAFDATEVFEFPTGTSDAEGRDKVAQILLQRARERQSQWERIKPVVGLRTGSLYRLHKLKPVHFRSTHYIGVAWFWGFGAARKITDPYPPIMGVCHRVYATYARAANAL